MLRVRSIALFVALALPSIARADVTVIYAAPSERAPLVARPVCPVGMSESACARAAATPPTPPPPPRIAITPPPPPRTPEPRVAITPPPPPRTPQPAALPPAPSACAAPVTFVRGSERRSLVLLDCDGRPHPESLVALSVLARPPGAPLPDPATLVAHASDPTWVAPSIRRLHPGLLERLRVIADRFPGHAIEIVSGDRPDARPGSRHLHGLALDLRVSGASLDAVHELVSRFDRTGVGLYPAGGFLHLDVRTRATRWVDASGPGEPPRPTPEDAPPRAARIRRVPTPDAPAPPPPRPSDDELGLDADAIVDALTRELDARMPTLAPPRLR
ncbi:DUF882 domain-containing protein [Sandaracinus amylolyticus]|uniref:Outer membrane protein, OmpA/MotB family n=1 Tax=Sandaracinus amylolyticus TaxID=927083 RepID=A0A0F6SE08_9BACT|nr:DUF882 domain-containing protein [Sandaracinus amylolyticus]AKF04369.1 Outer membrane protein, OmpA/MotB family [Sandaracinus amylolyticus]